jgi:hypothetical protein
MKSKHNYKYYKSIETLPVWNWDKIQSTADVKYIVATDDYDDVIENEEMHTLFDKIFDEYYNYFGVSDDMKRYLNAKKQITLLEVKIALKEATAIDYTNLNHKRIEFANIYEQEKNDIDKVAIQLSRHFKIDFDLRKMSVKRFYNYLETFTKERNNG